MPKLVFKRDGASFEAFFVHTADRIDVMKAWNPSVDDLMFLSRDDLVRLGDGNFQFTSKDLKKDIATCLVRDWDKVISFFGNKSYSYTLPSFGSIGGASSHQEKDTMAMVVMGLVETEVMNQKMSLQMKVMVMMMTFKVQTMMNGLSCSSRMELQQRSLR